MSKYKKSIKKQIIFNILFFFLLSQVSLFSENPEENSSKDSLILNSIKEELILKNYFIMESQYDEGAYINNSGIKEYFIPYNSGYLPKTLNVERRMYTIKTDFYLNECLKNEHLAGYIDPIEYPFNIYINDILVYKKSRFKENRATSRFSTSVIYFSKDILKYGKAKNNIVIQIYPIYKIDPISQIKIMDYDKAMEQGFWRDIFSIHVIQGAFFLSIIIAVYFLFLFITHKLKIKMYLVYSVYSYSFAMAYITVCLQYYSDSVIFLEKISRIGFPLCVIFLTIFILEYTRTMLKRHSLLKKIFLVIGVLASLLIIFQDTCEKIEFIFGYIMNIVIAPLLLFSIVILIISLIQKRKIGILVVLVSFIIIICTSIHDIYFMNTSQNPYIWLVPYGFLSLILSTFFVLALENSQVYFKSVNQARQIIKSFDALKKTEQKNKAILNAIPDSMFQLDRTGVVIDYKASSTLSGLLNKSKIIGMNIKKILIPKLAVKFNGYIDKVFKTEEPLIVEQEYATHEGVQSYYEIRMVLSNEDRVLAIVRDITTEKEAQKHAKFQEQQLVQADKLVALGTLVAGVAHEINNPNNSILLTSEVLLDTWKTLTPLLNDYVEKYGDFKVGGYTYTELQKELPNSFKRVINNSRRIRNIVTELKNFSRKDIPGTKGEVDINSLVKSSIKLVDNLIKTSTKNFVEIYDDDMPLVKIQVQRLEQVIINLLQNACHALDNDEKRIIVSTKYDSENNKAIIKIKDEGIGMNKETLGRILDPFFTTKRSEGGTGLGLAISAQIIKEHKGTLFFEARLNKGTTANIVLPVV